MSVVLVTSMYVIRMGYVICCHGNSGVECEWCGLVSFQMVEITGQPFTPPAKI